VVEVLDTGRHIAERHRRLLCEGGHWAGTAGDAPDATGLGLSLAHRFVDLHGGEIRVDGEASFGTRVQVILPLVQTGAGEPAGDSLPEAAMDLVPLLKGDAYARPSLPPAAEADEAGEQADAKKTTVLVV